MTVLSPDSKKKERLCCIFPGSVLEIRKEINQIFKDELSLFFKSKTMEKVFENINVCAIIKNKQSIKKPCGKNQNIGNKRHSRKFVHTPSTSGTDKYCL